MQIILFLLVQKFVFSALSPRLIKTKNMPQWSSVIYIALFLFCAYPTSAKEDKPQVIGRVTIRNQGVFDSGDPRYTHFPYPLLNQLHLKTRSSIIRREVLFKKGDSFSEDLIEESARNLRQLSFVGHVKIEALHRSNGKTQRDTVDLVVNTEDQWTTTPDVLIDRRGGLSRLGIGLEEHNLLGLGKYLNIRYATSTDRTLWRGIYKDPRLLGSQWRLNIRGINSSEGEQARVRIERPLHTLRMRWALGGYYTYENGIDRLYERGDLSASVRRFSYNSGFYITRTWGKENKRRQKISLELSKENRRYTNRTIQTSIHSPATEHFLRAGTPRKNHLYIGFNLESESTDFVHRRFIDQAGLIEDIRVGPSISTSVTWAQSLTENIHSYSLAEGRIVHSVISGEKHLAIAAAEGSLQLNKERMDNGKTSLFLHYYFQGLPWQTIAIGTAFQTGWRMDQPFQFVLGEDVGLRGFRARQFTGNKLVLFNLEDRLFTPFVLATMRLGAAAFVDAGMVWEDEKPARWDELAVSSGLSLRLGMAKSAGAPVFRLDIAFPLNHTETAGRYSIGFSFSPVFRAFRSPESNVGRF